MRIFGALTLVTATLLSLPAKPGSLELNGPLPPDARATGRQLLTSPGQTRHEYTVAQNGIAFSVCIDESGHIVHISTSDPKFRTPEGIGMGATLREVRQRTDVPLAVWPGYAFVLRLPSGWLVAFTHGQAMTEEPLPEETTVAFFFKGRLAG